MGSTTLKAERSMYKGKEVQSPQQIQNRIKSRGYAGKAAWGHSCTTESHIKWILFLCMESLKVSETDSVVTALCFEFTNFKCTVGMQ